MITKEELLQYVSGEKSLCSLTELLALPDVDTFFRVELKVFKQIPSSRQSAERVMEYLRQIDSIVGWECLIKQWLFLSLQE